MGKQRWFLGCLCVVILGVGPSVVLAQQPAQPPAAETQKDALEDIQLTRAVIQVERQAIVTQAMDLTPAEMETFWPLYRSTGWKPSRSGIASWPFSCGMPPPTTS